MFGSLKIILTLISEIKLIMQSMKLKQRLPQLKAKYKPIEINIAKKGSFKFSGNALA